MMFPKLESTYIFIGKENEVQMRKPYLDPQSSALYKKKRGGYRNSGTPNGFEEWIVYKTKKCLLIMELACQGLSLLF